MSFCGPYKQCPLNEDMIRMEGLGVSPESVSEKNLGEPMGNAAKRACTHCSFSSGVNRSNRMSHSSGTSMYNPNARSELKRRFEIYGYEERVFEAWILF